MADEDWPETDEYVSGPYCARHYTDPGDCDYECATCGHECRSHNGYRDGGDEVCEIDGCACGQWKSKADNRWGLR